MKPHIHSKYIFGAATFVLLAGQVCCLASGADETGGDSDIFAGGLFTALFNIVLFLVVLAVLGKWAWQPLLNSLQKREDYIKRSLEEADQAKEQAERSLKSYESKLKLANEETRRILEKSKQDAHQAAEAIIQEAKAYADEIRRQTKADIDHAREMALKEVYHHVATLATDLAGQIIHKKLDLEEQKQLIQASLDLYEKRRN